MEYDRSDIRKAVALGFSYIESLDKIVGSVYVTPKMAKQIVLTMSEDVTFDYIPEGIGMLRTAYLKYLPAVKDNELRLIDQDMSTELRVFLI